MFSSFSVVFFPWHFNKIKNTAADGFTLTNPAQVGSGKKQIRYSPTPQGVCLKGKRHFVREQMSRAGKTNPGWFQDEIVTNSLQLM